MKKKLQSPKVVIVKTSKSKCFKKSSLEDLVAKLMKIYLLTNQHCQSLNLWQCYFQEKPKKTDENKVFLHEKAVFRCGKPLFGHGKQFYSKKVQFLVGGTKL